jgi:hypothetical protein
MAARRGRRECVVGSGGRRGTDKNAANGRAGSCISERECTKTAKLPVVMRTWDVGRERIVVERLGAGIACGETDEMRCSPFNRRLLLARDVSKQMRQIELQR